MDTGLVEWLRQLRGIERRFTDFRGETREASDETVLAILAAMGHAVNDEAALRREAEALDELDWVRVLPPVVVCRSQRRVPLTFIAPMLPDIRWRVELEDGEVVEGSAVPDGLPVLDERGVRGLWYKRIGMDLPELPVGYHRLTVEKTDGSMLGSTRLIVAPERCYEPEAVRQGARLWGPAVQLYSLRSPRNWGMGDFTDLAEFVEAAADLGADLVGLNPLHALFPADPAMASPYGPASRNFLNVLYIDPEAVPEFASCAEARRLVSSPEFQVRLSTLRQAGFVDYPGVAACKLEVLRHLYENFRVQASPRRISRFESFVRQGGEDLETLSVFSALHEHFSARGIRAGWPGWPEAYRDPDSAAVEAFRSAEAETVEFHKWLQWVAADQLREAEARAREAGMCVGLYRDLAVGVAGSSAEVWADPDLYTTLATVGAPPDALALQGQDWGIPPMRPDELRERGYEPFIRMLRANMGRGGALRIDHVMVLFRLWWVPAGKPSAEGTYVYYRLDEMMAIVALESQRHCCLVIGEDLGTVPPEIRQAMPAHGMYSYRVFFFEKEEDGGFIRPADYPAQALATLGTHDLPPFVSWWEGTDIALRERLGLYPDPDLPAAAREERARDRRAILEALEDENLLPDSARDGNGAPASVSPELVEAVQLYLARSSAGLMAVQPEDWLHMDSPVNVPGTVDEYPNWSRKLREDWGRFMSAEPVVALAGRITAARGL
ncbi:MAG: 4-alpha-glucanotransferase [Gammaproteobacteria bacterium]